MCQRAHLRRAQVGDDEPIADVNTELIPTSATARVAIEPLIEPLGLPGASPFLNLGRVSTTARHADVEEALPSPDCINASGRSGNGCGGPTLEGQEWIGGQPGQAGVVHKNLLSSGISVQSGDTFSSGSRRGLGCPAPLSTATPTVRLFVPLRQAQASGGHHTPRRPAPRRGCPLRPPGSVRQATNLASLAGGRGPIRTGNR